MADGSFGRLAAYVSDLKKIGDLRDWRLTADYILDRKDGGGRVGAIRVTNCQYEEPGIALAEIEATQARNTTSKTDKTYHLIVSFPLGEKPTPAQLHDIEDTLCAAIGLADHQRISAVHNDTDHFHFHVAINKVHPETFRVVTPYFDQARLQAACIELEKKHGLTPTNHQMPERGPGRRNDRAEAMELHGRQQSLIQWVRDEAGPALLAAQETGQGWQDLHRAAAAYGLEIKPRGAGLVIAVVGDKYARVKPSDIDRRLSFGALTKKWGEYQAPAGRQPEPTRVYPRAPLQTRNPKTAELFKSYQRDRDRALAERKAGQEAASAVSQAYRTEFATWAAERRAAIKRGLHPAGDRRSAYRALNRTRTEAMQAEKARLDAVRKATAAANPLLTWPQWLANQAANGNAEALDVMRATEQRKAELGAAVLSAADAGHAKHIVYQHLKPTVGRDGSVTYNIADGGRVTDRADHIRVDNETTAATLLALTLAADRFSAPLVVTGTDAFKRQVAQVAAIQGLGVTFADPSMEAERQRHAAAREATRPAPPAPAPSVKEPEGPAEALAFIASRNAVGERVHDIKPHRLWTPKDAGEAVYAGRRNIGNGVEVILLDGEKETLVKVVSNAQAARAAGWTIGDVVTLDNRGRTIDHRSGRAGPEQEEEQQSSDLGR